MTRSIAEIIAAARNNEKLDIPGPGHNLDEEFIVDITHYLHQAHYEGNLTSINLEDYPPTMRFIARVSYPAQGASPTPDDFLGRRIQLCVTNLPEGYSPQYIDKLYYKRGRAEQKIRDVKATGLGKLPFTSFTANQIWALTAALAHSLTIWAGLLIGPDQDTVGYYTANNKNRWWLWEPKTLRARLFSIAGKITRSARQTQAAFDGHHPFSHTLTQLITRLQRLRI